MWDFVGIIVIQTSMQGCGYGTKGNLIHSSKFAYCLYKISPHSYYSTPPVRRNDMIFWLLN